MSSHARTYTRTHTRTHAHTHIFIDVHKKLHMPTPTSSAHARTETYIHRYTHACKQASKQAHTHVHRHACTRLQDVYLCKNKTIDHKYSSRDITLSAHYFHLHERHIAIACIHVSVLLDRVHKYCQLPFHE